MRSIGQPQERTLFGGARSRRWPLPVSTRRVGVPGFRFRILRTLLANDELSASELKQAVDVEPHNFHYHLDQLVDVGLVDKRQRRTADSRGFYTYYRPTAMGRGILEHGVEELMRREREFNDAYA